MMKDKGWPKALEAAKILKNKNVDFIFNFAGSWPSKLEENEFANFVEQNNLSDNVKYHGFVNKSQKHTLLADSDILVFPTEYKFEALPRVIIEAMEFGIPQISTTNGSIPSTIIHYETGFLLKENSSEEIAKFILKLENKTNLIEMGRKARNRFLSNYELTVFRKNFLYILEKTIDYRNHK
jgi:glycosyltransferase involved in cell wall biosynthesis